MLLALLWALSSPAGDSASVYRGSAGELRVQVPRHQDADIRIDGRLDEALWRSATVLTGFTLYEPVESRSARDETEVRIFYTSDAIYFGIRAHDSAPDRIRATLAERDRAAFNDDWVRIMLDTFNDQRQAYCFYVNPYGIQTDGLWIEGGQRQGSPVPIDFNPDYIWSSEGRVEGDGWTAEIRIPYVSLRFREVPLQDWGINIARETRANGYKMSWAPITQNRTSTLSQSGTLVGLADLRSHRLVEANPVITGKRTGELRTSGFEMQSFEPEVGVNARVGITQNLVADFTVNPDFSQIEADADQITVNERFALFLQEKRPFFLEGADIFRTPQQLVYTRSIVDPAGGVKVTGKVGAFNVGYVGALDDAPRRDPEIGERAAVNLLRIRRDLGTGSTLGALYTDRTLLGGLGFNRIMAADARLLFAQRYTLTTQLAHSWTRAPGSDAVVGSPLVYASFLRSGRKFNFELTAEDLPPDFQAQAGFLRRIGDARALASGKLNLYGTPGALLERFGLGLDYESFYDHTGLWDGHAPFESELELTPEFDFGGTSSLTMILRRGYFRFEREPFDDLAIDTGSGVVPIRMPGSIDNMQALALMPRLRPFGWLQIDGRLYLREIPIYQEGVRGFEVQAAPTIKLWPSDGLSLELSYTHSDIQRSRAGTHFSTQDLTRVKAQYQFTKALFARAIVQYNLRSRDALRDADTGLPLISLSGASTAPLESGDFGTNLLVSYQPSPGTLVYLGWARQMTGPDTYRLDRLERTAEGLFVKFSYLHRL
jgi:hypothetical protein